MILSANYTAFCTSKKPSFGLEAPSRVIKKSGFDFLLTVNQSSVTILAAASFYDVHKRRRGGGGGGGTKYQFPA